MDWSKIKIGDTVTVKTWNRDGRKTATRKVVQISTLGVGINLFGWKPFYLQGDKDKIIKVVKK
jgi:hypothetical protein